MLIRSYNFDKTVFLKSHLFSRLLGANMPFLFCSLMDFAWFWLWYWFQRTFSCRERLPAGDSYLRLIRSFNAHRMPLVKVAYLLWSIGFSLFSSHSFYHIGLSIFFAIDTNHLHWLGECAQEGGIMSAIRRRQVTHSLHWVLKRRRNWRLLTIFCAKIMYSFYLRKYLRHFFPKKVKFIRNLYKIGGILTRKSIFSVFISKMHPLLVI